ncbi:hypothetical protein P7K49_010078 [Saguinus oedipus]|uniref:Uncharacterized protein n=1 Tax=Saguinus oedipus TaxID=9490 RepID=A0ABQ9VQ26_SAGOE|nr:hypothetical protein P7K49_010078 [Saguinus oedipus]
MGSQHGASKSEAGRLGSGLLAVSYGQTLRAEDQSLCLTSFHCPWLHLAKAISKLSQACVLVPWWALDPPATLREHPPPPAVPSREGRRPSPVVTPLPPATPGSAVASPLHGNIQAGLLRPADSIT